MSLFLFTVFRFIVIFIFNASFSSQMHLSQDFFFNDEIITLCLWLYFLLKRSVCRIFAHKGKAEKFSRVRNYLNYLKIIKKFQILKNALKGGKTLIYSEKKLNFFLCMPFNTDWNDLYDKNVCFFNLVMIIFLQYHPASANFV